MATNLSDSELFEKLRHLGVDVGPVNEATRAVYVKKYRALLTTAKKENSPRGGRGPTPHTPPTPKKRSSVSPAVHHRSKKVQDTTPPHLSAPPPTTPPDLPAERVVVEHLLQTFDNCSHVCSDTAFLFPEGEMILASRAILAAQCHTLIPLLYNMQAPYSVKVSTLTGQTSEFFIRSDELVLDLKEKICLVHGIPIHEQRLVFKQQELQDSSRFAESEVQSGSTLHLVLVMTEAQTVDTLPSTTTFRCPNMTPTLSIHHFRVGFSPEQLSHCASLQTTPLKPHPQRISLPSHLTHIVHVYDVPYQALWSFLHYLHCRTLQEGSCDCGALVLCFVLAEWFQVPSLATACLSLLPTLLNMQSAQRVLHFAEAVNSQPLQHLCSVVLSSASH